MKSILLILWFLMLGSIIAYGQTQIKGLVTDTLNQPIDNVNVTILVNQRIVYYSHTDKSGNYTINIPKDLNGEVMVAVTCIGYASQTLKYIASIASYNFTLKFTAINLKTVKVRNLPAITLNHDTLNYKTSDFTGLNDRTIGDVLKNIPGIDVQDDGKIYFNNKAISNLYIDGDNLLDDRYNIATNVIPSRIVGKVQVIQHDQPIKLLRKNNLSDDVSINLVINKNQRLQTIGSAQLSAGLPSKYDEDIDQMLFKDEFKFLNNLGLNNVGNDVSNDVISHNSIAENFVTENDIPDYQLSPGINIVPYLPASRYLVNNSGITNNNYLFKINQDKQIKINAYYLIEDITQNSSSNTLMNFPENMINYFENQENTLTTQKLHTQLNYIDNSAGHYFDNNFSLDYCPVKNNGHLLSDNQQFSQSLGQYQFSLLNKLHYLKKLKSGAIVDLNSYIEKRVQNEHLDLSPGLDDTVLNADKAYIKSDQHADLPGYFTNNYVNFSKTINDFTQSYRAGFTYQSLEFNSMLTNIESNNNQQLVVNGENQTKWNKAKVYVTPAFTYKTDLIKAELSIPVSENRIQYSNYSDSLNKLYRLFVNPSLTVKYQISEGHQLSIGYSFKTSVGNIQDVYNGIILSNYRTISSNDGPLPFVNTNHLFFGINFQNPIEFLFANIQVSYTDVLLNILTEYDITNILSARNSILYGNSINTFTLNGSVGKYIASITTNLSVGAIYSQSKGLQLQNDIILPYKSTTVNAYIKSSSKISSAITLTYIGNYTASSNDIFGGNFEKNYLRHISQVSEINSKVNKRMILGFEENDILVEQSRQANLNYFFSDINVTDRILKLKTDVTISLNNLANIKTYRTSYVDVNSLSYVNYQIPGRYILLKCRINF